MRGLRLLISSLPVAVVAAAVGYAGYSLFRSRTPQLPPPGPRKLDPDQLDELLDVASEDSMAASDPPSTSQPEVRH